MPEPAPFKVLASNKLVGFPDGNVISWCPHMDLLAVSMNQTLVWVFRPDNERVYAVNNRAPILSLCWSENGRFFALAGTDNLIKVYNANNGALVSTTTTTTEKPITLVSWCSVDIELSVTGGADQDQFLRLFKVDILKQMPKLLIESSSSDNLMLLKMTSLPYETTGVVSTTDSDKAIDYMFVVNQDTFLVTLNNFMKVADVPLPTEHELLRHSIGQGLFQQKLLLRDRQLALLMVQDLLLDIPEPNTRGWFMDTVDWASQLICISQHITDQIGAITKEAQDYLRVWDRHLLNYKDSLAVEDPDPAPFVMVSDLTRMVMTGQTPPSMKDYWVNAFGERGLMRLSSVGNTAYDNCRKVLFAQVILGCEKLLILLTHLEGLSLAARDLKQDNFGIDLEVVAAAVELAQTLAKQIYSFIWKLNDEQEGFNKFLNWLQIEVIEQLTKGESDPDAFLQAHPAVEFPSLPIIEYIEDSLLLPVFLNTFEIKTTDFDVLTGQDAEITSISANAENLGIEIGKLTSKIQASIALKFTLGDVTPLDLQCDGNLCDMQHCDTGLLVSAVSGNTVTVWHNGATQTHSFGTGIISYKMLGSLRLLVLYASNGYYLELLDISGEPRVLNRTQFEAVDAGAPLFMAINGTHNKTHIIGLVMNDSKKEYTVFEI